MTNQDLNINEVNLNEFNENTAQRTVVRYTDEPGVRYKVKYIYRPGRPGQEGSWVQEAGWEQEAAWEQEAEVVNSNGSNQLVYTVESQKSIAPAGSDSDIFSFGTSLVVTVLMGAIIGMGIGKFFSQTTQKSKKREAEREKTTFKKQVRI